MTDDTCTACGAPVIRTKSAVWNLAGNAKPLHAQTCTAPKKAIWPSETVADVRRRHS